MLRRMTYKEMSNMSNQVFSELHLLKEVSEKFYLLNDRRYGIECRIKPYMFGDAVEEPHSYLQTSCLTENSIKLDLIKGIDEIVNFLVSIDSTHGLDIIDDIAERLPESAYGINYCSTLITNYFKGDYFND